MRWLPLIGWIALAEAAGIIGSFFTTDAIAGWYTTLVRPELSPPNWVFAPVWTTLFLLMGIAAYLVWQKGTSRRDVRIALGVFIFQLVLNTAWSIIFFGSQQIGFALAEIALLWLAIVATVIAFARISRPAAWLLAPYLAWVSFASYLNYAFWVLN